MNKVMLMGRLVKEPELRYSQNQVAVTKFTIAVNRRFVKQGEERQADFFNCVCFRSTAEFVSKYFVKGQQLALTGTLQSRKWEDEAGKSHTVIDVVAEEVYFAGEKPKQADQQQDVFLPVDEGNFPF